MINVVWNDCPLSRVNIIFRSFIVSCRFWGSSWETIKNYLFDATYTKIYTKISFSLLQSCQVDLVKDKGHLYFLSVLGDQYMPVSVTSFSTDTFFSCPWATFLRIPSFCLTAFSDITIKSFLVPALKSQLKQSQSLVFALYLVCSKGSVMMKCKQVLHPEQTMGIRWYLIPYPIILTVLVTSIIAPHVSVIHVKNLVYGIFLLWMLLCDMVALANIFFFH